MLFETFKFNASKDPAFALLDSVSGIQTYYKGKHSLLKMTL